MEIEQKEGNTTSSLWVGIDKINNKGKENGSEIPKGSIFEDTTTEEVSNTKTNGGTREISAGGPLSASLQTDPLLGINSFPYSTLPFSQTRTHTTFTYSYTPAAAPTTFKYFYTPASTPSYLEEYLHSFNNLYVIIVKYSSVFV